MCETGMVLAEISYMLKHMQAFGKDQTVRTPLARSRPEASESRRHMG